jgi:hypothetical protein
MRHARIALSTAPTAITLLPVGADFLGRPQPLTRIRPLSTTIYVPRAKLKDSFNDADVAA